MIPILYKPEEKEYKSDGLGLLKETTFCHITELANSNFELELHYPTASKYDEYFTNEYQILAKPNDVDDPHAFKIYKKTIDEFTNQVIVYAHSRTYKLGKRGVQSVLIDSQNGLGAMKAIEAGMDEKSDIELFSDVNTVSSTNFEHRNVLNCIAGEQGSLLQYWGGEIKRENHRLSLLKRRGRDNVMSVSYRKNLTGLKVIFSWDGMLTKIVPYAELQNNDGKTDVIYGSPVYSAMVDKYPDVYFDFVQFTEDQGVTDLASLNKVASGYFTKLNPGVDMPAISIEANIEDLASTENGKKFQNLRKLGLFDTFQLEHELWGLDFETKVNAIVYDVLLEKVHSIKAGAAQKTFYQSQNDQLQTILKSQAEKKYMSVFVDYVTKVISGNDGGNVVWWPKERPSDLFFIDTDNLETAKQVLRLNKSGIGFSEKGWQGPYETAWTLDGVFNADFIRTGTIMAEVFMTSFNNVGDALKLVSGALQIFNGKTKILELTKKGLEFWNDKTGIGTMGTTAEGFAGTEDSGSTTQRAIAIELSDGGEFIKISGSNSAGLFIPGSKKLSTGADVMLINNSSGGLVLNTKSAAMAIGGKGAENQVKIVAPGGLYLNGSALVPGGTGGGGGWNGQYPSEITSQSDKFAWQLWIYLLSQGYSKASAAGILGNASRETGGTMNPDTDQVGGPAYGIVQWDGSRYPLVGSSTTNGREYVQRLMSAAGITDDYRTMIAQGKLLEWSMTHGQWIGQVSPTTVSGFKAETNVYNATYAFLKNYERAGVEELGQRVDAANYFYNKFKDLKQPGGTGGYVLPVRAGTPVTSWFGPRWGTNHNGIDFGAPLGDPVFASKEGEVVASMPTAASGGFGEYIIIKHSDGYMTGYAHMTTRFKNVGDKVSQGQQIGTIGSTGDSTGPHLHFSIQTDIWGPYKDPAPFLGLTPP